MRAGEEDRRRDEIVLVRRRSEEHDGGHHGGAWKIAYADFMTAMMALFLVMWLVNAASKDTRAQVASYFNPIKLSDSITSRRGLSAMQPGERSRQRSRTTEQFKSGTDSKVQDKVKKSSFSEAEFFSDPHGVLAKLATQNAQRKTPRQKGIAFRDPFDPAFQRKFESAQFQELPPARNAERSKPDWSATVKRHDGNVIKPAEAKPGSQKAHKASPVQILADRLKKEIRKISNQRNRSVHPGVEVDVTKEGVVLSLTDQVGYSMFDLGSAVPKPATVALVDTLAAAIKSHHKGRLVISGHTDARVFSGAKYNNWRLSTDRAHAFYHMLARGGVDMSRVERVQGFAAQKPKVIADPNSPLNRRVEITLRTGS